MTDTEPPKLRKQYKPHARPPIDFDMFTSVLAGAIKARGASYRDVAKECGVSFSAVHRVASGTESSDLATYALLCRWLGVSLDTFVARGNAKSKGER